MASEYDALLEEPAQKQQASPYDALLTAPEQPKEPSILRNIGEAALETAKGFIPKSVEQAAEMASPAVGAVKEIISTPRKLYDVAFGGKSIEETFPSDLVEVDKTPAFSKERFQEGFGMLAQLGMVALGAKGGAKKLGERPTLTETVHGTPEAETPVAEATQPAEQAPVESHVEANKELAPATTQEPVESFPSLLQSAEEQRRAESQQQPPAVREAISLDELRLMRERTELQLQNDLSKRATGGTHPAVDERLGQIDDELTSIANRELQTQGGGEVQAVEPQEQIADTGARPAVPVSTEGEATVAQGNTKEVPPTAETPTTSGKATQEGQAAPEPKITDEPHISAIRNQSVQERAAKGEIGEIVPGQGYSTTDLAQRGLKMSPEEINQHVSDLMAGKSGDPVLQGSAVRAEDARLSQRSNDLSRAAAANPTDLNAQLAADNAFKDLTDFHNGPVARIKTIFHGTGQALQGEIPVDLSTFNGLREAWLRDTGKAPPVSLEPKIREMAQNVSKANGEETGAMQNLGKEIERNVSRSKVPNAEDVRNSIAERMKVEPCLT